MRSIDLALYADVVSAEAASLAARLERARGELRRAAIEYEARLALADETVERLERLGVLGAQPAGDGEAEIAAIHASLRAVESLQAWIEARLTEHGRGADTRAGDERRGEVAVAG